MAQLVHRLKMWERDGLLELKSALSMMTGVDGDIQREQYY